MIEKVAVFDDEPSMAHGIAVELEDAGFLTDVIEGYFETTSEFVDRIRDTDDGAVCDLRLAPRGAAKFDGAEAVAALYDIGVPAVLVTTYPMDEDAVVRRWRAKIPSFVPRTDLGPEVLKDALERAAAELAGDPPPDRQSYRSVVRIDAVTSEAGVRVVDAVVTAWDPLQAIRFPLDLVGQDLREQVEVGTRLLADVNIGSGSSGEMFLLNFEPAPEALSEDELL